METLTSELTQLAEFEGELLVVPASEIRETGVRSAAQARLTFGVNLAVSGSIQQYGDGMRVTLNLVDAVNERQLHSKIVYERREDVSSLQDSSVAKVAQMLDVQIRPESRLVLAPGRAVSSAAYGAYLEGLGCLQRNENANSLDSALYLFRRAIGQDSGYALAYAGIGEAYWRKYGLTGDVSWLTPAKANASRALELNDRLVPVLVTMGLVHVGTGQSEEAISYFKRALDIDPMNSEAYDRLASAYESLGRVAEAQSTYEISIKLKPHDWHGYYNLAKFLAVEGRINDALKQLAAADSLAPAATYPYELFGNLYTFLGTYEKAKTCLQR
jgi:eukaryotic-like serine/threonine-protein kinase